MLSNAISLVGTILFFETLMTNKEILRRLYEVIKPYQVKLLVAMLAMICVSAGTGAQTWLVKDVLDKIFIEKNTFYLKVLPLVLLLIFFLKGLVYYIYSMLLQQVGQSVIRDFRQRIFDHIHRQSLTFFNKMPTGTLMSRIISDVALLQQTVSNTLVGAVRDFFQVLILLGIVFSHELAAGDDHFYRAACSGISNSKIWSFIQKNKYENPGRSCPCLQYSP